MVKKIKKFFKKIGPKRTTVLILLFCVLFAVLIQRLFSLQIIHGQEYADNFNLNITKERTIKGTRGNIRDRNGQLIAYNQLSYSIIMEDNGTYDTTREKNLTLNYVSYELLQILQKNNETTDIAFYIVLGEDGSYEFSASGFTLNRFKADVYGEANIENLKDEQLNATAEEMMAYMSGEERFALVNKEKPYTEEELSGHGLPQSFTPQETLEIVKMRYILSTNSFQKYMPVTIATNVSEETVAEVMERKDQLQGIDIMEDSIRVYDGAEYLAPLIGYTGKASAEELDALEEAGYDDYPTDAIIGKAGIEQLMETQLQGKDGSEKVHVDRLGKVLDIDESSRKEPEAGNDVYLSIDKDLQEVAYRVLEQKISGILVSNIVNQKTFDYVEGMDTADIKTPIYDVYNALIENSVLDIDHFKAEDATSLEKNVYSLFQQRQETVFGQIREELTKDNPQAYESLPEYMQEYQKYIVDTFLKTDTGILSSGAIDASDSIQNAWSEGTVSMKEYLTYAAGKNWIDISKFSAEGEYLDSSEVYQALSEYLTASLADDDGFSKIIYKYMIQDDMISGTQLCMLLYDQGILEADEATYNALASGSMRAYDFMLNKISNLEITPAQLALDPCSGSVVITDVNTGETLACVSYPGYDNNRLANNMDIEYFQHINEDLSSPLYNKATQEKRAPGSTFKILTAVAGIEEGIVTDNYGVVCNGVFEAPGIKPVNCSNRYGHGYMNIVSGITNSCNDFFCQIGYDLGKDAQGNYSDSLGVETLTKYADMFRLDEKSGLEIEESMPQVATTDATRMAIGQSENNYTTSQLARYVTTIASRGTSYQLSLLDKVTDADGNLVEDFTPEVKGDLDVADSTWETVQAGMRGVAKKNSTLSSLKVAVAGKTGTAQEDLSRPSHGTFIGFAPYEDPGIAMAVRITHGYTSGNAVSVANDIFRYKYNLADKSEIISGSASTDNISMTEQTD